MLFSNTKRRNLLIALILTFILSLSVAVACAVNHNCENKCQICGLCLSECDDAVCADKCPRNHSDAHFCEHACPDCGLCTSGCTDQVCKEKCKNDHDENGRMYVEFGDVRVGVLSDTVVRVEAKGPKGFENRKTYLVSNRSDWEVPEYSVTTEGNSRVVVTENYKVYVPVSVNKDLKGVRITDTEGELLWEYTAETTANVYLPSPSDELGSWFFTDNPRVVPSDYGYGFNPEKDDPLNGWDFDNKATDCYVFLPQGDYSQFCSDYVNLTGRSEMVSLQMLGYWDSRWFAYSSETALQQIQDYIDRGYSIDILVIDKDWHTDNGVDGVGYQVNTELFPNMSEFLDKCHELGINIMFNDHPEPVGGTGNVLDKDEVQYRNEQMTMILGLGLDYWWYDRNWSVSLNKPDPDISVYAFGMYIYQFITNDYLESIADVKEYTERALIMGNVDGCLHGKWTYASDLSAHRYSIQWTGDIGTDSNALAQEIYATVFGGAEVGLPYVSSDLGGHTSSVTDDMYIRWLQYGALSTICRVHCTNVDQIGQDGRMPWLFGDTAEEVVHEYVDMRYRLLPLFYSLSRENYDTGLPIMRRTDIAYPQYNEASRNDQYMLGENVLVAPFDSAERLIPVPTEMLTDLSGGKGLTATYFNGTDLKNVAYTKTDPNVYFNWETKGPQGLGDDQFSVRWEGKITFGDKDGRLCLFADDGVRVWVDGKLVVDAWDVYDTMKYSGYYTAGTTHDIKVEYREDYGGAHVYMYYAERAEDGSMIPNTRTVFIPDGTWIDVWTGERFRGPQTITVAHGLTTSPIFVREGAVLALAENMVNTSAKDWSNMSLDVYAGKTPTKTTLYEDDTTSQAYKYGQYRKTLITNAYADGKYTVTVNAAEGEFKGARAFNSRTWTVRVHALSEWGTLKTLKVNGKTVTNFRTYEQDNNSTPFAYSGAALDGRIYEFTVTSDVYEQMIITFSFTGEVTDLEIPDYDASTTEFTVTTGESGDSLDLTASGEVDWAYFGYNDANTVVRKDAGDRFIGELDSYSSLGLLGNSLIYASWSDGEGKFPAVKGAGTGATSQKDFSLTFKVDTTKRYYVLNLGGEQCTAKITVRDRAGHAKTINFGNLNGSFSKRVVIEAQCERESEIQITYSVLVSKPDGTGSPSKVWISSVYVTEDLKDPVYVDYSKLSVTVARPETPAGTVDLSTAPAGEKVADWRHFDSTKGAPYITMAGGKGVENVIFSQSQDFGDYASSMTWSDGEEINTETAGTTHGTCSFGDITLSVSVNAKTSAIELYTGVWKATNTVRVYNAKGELIGSANHFAANETAAARLVKIAVNSEIDTVVTIVISRTNGDGNVSLAAVRALEKV